MYAVDTIAAVATPPGAGGIGIVRVSGPAAVAIAERVVDAARPVAAWASRRLHRARLLAIGGAVIDDGLAILMRRPHSYTGEDVLELHCHGSPLVLRQVLAHVLRCGARAAEPGEFTKRAFLNGRLDLAQAEAVADLIAARSPHAATLAAAQLGGALSEVLTGIRNDLIDLKALLEAQIDFSEEDVSISPPQLIEVLDRSMVSIKKLDKTYEHGSFVRNGLRIAIVGRPNVGKSSLLNALLGSDRAIVTDRPGTTRDTIEEAADFQGIPVVLTDTAGLRAAVDADGVERIGMERTATALRQADVRLVVLDGSERMSLEDLTILDTVRNMRCVIVLNKSDMPVVIAKTEAESCAGGAPVVRVSATQLTGLDQLRRAVVDLVENGNVAPDDHVVVTSARHHAALLQAVDALALARASIVAGQTPDLIAVDVQDALDHIGSITGAISSEDVLDRIFSQFCIGK